MQKWMRNLARDYPHLVQLTSIGLTHEGRSIDGIEVDTIPISHIINPKKVPKCLVGVSSFTVP